MSDRSRDVVQLAGFATVALAVAAGFQSPTGLVVSLPIVIAAVVYAGWAGYRRLIGRVDRRVEAGEVSES